MAAAAASSSAATRITVSPRPSAWTARAKAATSLRAGSRSSSHNSGWLGKPIQTASCDAHSGGGGRIMGALLLADAALVSNRAEFGGRIPIGPRRTLGELATEAVEDRQILERAVPVPARIIMILRLVVAVGGIVVRCLLAGFL